MEYSLLAVAIAAIIVLVVFLLGTYVHGLFNHTNSCLSAGSSGTSC